LKNKKFKENSEFFSTKNVEQDIHGHTIRGGLVTMVVQIIKFAIQITSIVVLSRALDPEDFGLVAMVTVITGLVAMFKDGGLSMATIQQKEITQEQISNLFWLNAFIGHSLFLIIASLSIIIAEINKEPRLIQITLAIAATFLISGFSVQHEALLRRQMRFREIAVIDLVSMLSGVLVASAMAWSGLKYWSLVLMTIITSFMQAVLIIARCGWMPSLPKNMKGSVSMIKFGMNLSLANLIGYFSINATPFIIGITSGVQSVGIYNRANALVNIPSSQILLPIIGVVQPALARICNKKNEFFDYVNKLLRRVSVVSAIGSVIIFAYSDLIVRTFLGYGWGDAEIYVKYMAIIYFSEPVAGVMVAALLAAGFSRLLLMVKIVQLLIVIMFLSVGYSWGAVGLVAAYAISGIALRVHVLIIFSTKALGFSLIKIYKNFLQVLLFSVILLLTTLYFRSFISDLNFSPYLDLLAIPLGLAISIFVTFLTFKEFKCDVYGAIEAVKNLNQMVNRK
jgi:O-antigen/teichoic acid export membrane protein